MNFIKITRFDITNIIRNPTLLFSNTIFPFILIAIMGYVTKSSFGESTVSSYDYYGVNMIIFSTMLIAMTASNTFMEEKVKKGNIRIIYAPVSRTSIYLSKLLSTYIFGTICFSAILIVSQTLFQLNLGGQNLPYIILLINALLLFGCCFGTMFCCIFKSEEEANGFMQIPVAFFIFFGGVFFGVHRLGETVNLISKFSPVYWVSECAFRIIYDNDFSIFLPVTLGLLLASFFCIAICHIVFKPGGYV
ncbi:ABC transporter permease [Bacillus thuringiensis serovar medellin]|uniref:ABC transporter permease n=1 Tax=Bacillus thuringiensis subsp. medellin TaxID=79672 RepID=A0A9X6RHX9_BACTV|nr:ABC transporter permease [Bacillus thuringiensis]OUC02596.1 ABC transporter permease [Bacillus thuringiensis serovar medellin]